jgi:hypothetical protein
MTDNGSHTSEWTMVDAESSTTMVLNESDVDTQSVYQALSGPHPEVAQMIKWSISTLGDRGRSRIGSIFQRDRYVTPERLFDQFRVAYDAVDSDDVVGGVEDASEALAFNRVSFTALDEDEEDIWNQILFDLNLEDRLREMWRELFITSQFYAVTWWGTRSYKVRGTSQQGVKRKKTYDNLVVPLAVTILDPTKVVPIGNLMFNQEQLAYIADRTETDMLDAAVLNDPQADPISRQIIIGKYDPSDMERRNLARHGINADWLYILNPKYVWRHTLTRSQYERFAKVRMKSCFEILDLKHQLRQMDRAHLIGGTNFIILIRKGTDHLPAKPEEVNQLRGQVTMVAQMPIMVGDHRLSVDIVTPKQDVTLSADKYSVLDARLTSRLWGLFTVHGGMGQPRSDDSLKMAKVVSRGLEARRQALRRTIEREVVVPAVLANPALETVPSLRFHPSRIELSFDPATQTFIQDARDRGDLSRDSYLGELDFDQQWEAEKRKREARDYDNIFTQTNVPFSAPGPGHAVPVGPGGKPKEEPSGTSTNAPAVPGVPPHSHNPDGTPVPLPGAPARTTKSAMRNAGRNLGGNRGGGGAAPGTGQGKPPATGVPKKT